MKRDGGFTLIELLVSMVLIALILWAVQQTVLASARLHHVDKERVNDNRTLRGVLDLIGDDVRQAGERLPSAVPALQISASPSVLTIYRGLSDTYLPLCSVAGPSATNVYVSAASPNPDAGTYSPSGLSMLPDACGTVANIASPWQTVLQAKISSGAGDTMLGLLIDVTNKRSSPFIFSGVDSSNRVRLSGLTINVDPRRPAPTAANPVPPAGDVRLYLVEQRQYWMQNGKIYLSIDGLGGTVAMPGATAFTLGANADTISGSANVTLPFGALGATPTWRDLNSVSVTVGRQEGNTTRSLTAILLPRNALSNDQ